MYGGMLVLIGLLMGCGRAPAERVEWHDLIRDLLDTDRIARMDTRTAFLVSSSDPTGGNDDFNQYLRPGPDGWWVIADLQGPGYISRFWFTGAEDGSHRVRFYFDDESEPRIDMTIGEFCGGSDPYLPPLAVYENYCWYNLIPIPYQQRVVVMVEEGGYKPGNWPRIFYQINYHTLDRGETIDSYPRTLSEADRDVIRSVNQVWAEATWFPSLDTWDVASRTVDLPPGAQERWSLDTGPAVLRQISLTPEYAALPTATAREDLLRDIVVNLYWDDADAPSVSVPLGDFFGAFWRRNRYQTLYVGAEDDTVFSRFPKPFKQSMQVELVNEGASTVSIESVIHYEPLTEWDPRWGYFHAAWQRSSPQDVGQPHRALATEGVGKFVGCMLAVVSADQSWWILEADEWIRVDDETEPGWNGTGLEDYFNGGWYYQNAIIRPLTGIPFKMPFRVLQYRFHLMDPVHFQQSVDVMFERGPDHASRGWMESVAYYYMDRPHPAASDLRTRAQRNRPEDGFGQGTAMTEINNMERIGDYQGAHDFIDWFLELYADFPYAELLRLRQIAYRERFEGFDAVEPLYRAFLESVESDAARRQAENLLWFHEDPSHALLSGYANSRTALFHNGRGIGVVDSAEQMSVFRVTMNEGRHVLGMQARFHPYPNWVQAYLRTHETDHFTTPQWRWQFNARGPWTQVGFDDAQWPVVGGTGTKGPPEVPFVWVYPHAYIDMQSLAVGLRPSRDWTDQNALAAFRYEFDWP